MSDIKELTEKNLDKINGGIVCPDGINRPVYYDEHVFCPKCHEREYGKIFQPKPLRIIICGSIVYTVVSLSFSSCV